MSNQYRIEGPALLSISGGRTSGFMLRQIIDAHGGKLPSDVIPVFCNTGKEHEATLKFVKEMQDRWCRIVWLEYRNTDGTHRFVEVDYCSASRDGTPFDQVIAHRKTVPCRVARFCSGELKTRTGNRYAASLGWESWTRVIGMRAGEPWRTPVAADCPEEETTTPMHRAGHTLDDVLSFWKSQPFDLELPGNDPAFGNCDCCFLKRRARIEKVEQANPGSMEWWARHEEATGTAFRIDRPSYRQMMTQMRVQGRLLDDAIEDDTLPCQCTD